MLKKIIFVLFFTVFCSMNNFANNNHVTIEITGVNINDGNIYVEIYTNENDHKKGIPYNSFILESTNDTLLYELILPEGECLVWAYQDSNNNGKLDTGFFGIPKEPVALTNYNGNGIPGKFNRHKVPVDKNTVKITAALGIIKL